MDRPTLSHSGEFQGTEGTGGGGEEGGGDAWRNPGSPESHLGWWMELGLGVGGLCSGFFSDV